VRVGPGGHHLGCNYMESTSLLAFSSSQSVKLFIELHLAFTDLDDIVSRSPFNLVLEHGVLFIDWFNFLLTEG
jgi:hypothetical protein